MPETTFATLEEYAAHIRREMHTMMVRCSIALGAAHPIALQAGHLCTEAANLVHQNRMQEEVTDPDRYDLAALPMPALLTEENDEENPFREE